MALLAVAKFRRFQNRQKVVAVNFAKSRLKMALLAPTKFFGKILQKYFGAAAILRGGRRPSPGSRRRRDMTAGGRHMAAEGRHKGAVYTEDAAKWHFWPSQSFAVFKIAKKWSPSILQKVA